MAFSVAAAFAIMVMLAGGFARVEANSDDLDKLRSSIKSLANANLYMGGAFLVLTISTMFR